MTDDDLHAAWLATVEATADELAARFTGPPQHGPERPEVPDVA